MHWSSRRERILRKKRLLAVCLVLVLAGFFTLSALLGDRLWAGIETLEPTEAEIIAALPLPEGTNPDAIVYATASGTRFHRDMACGNMADPQPLTTIEAYKKGLAPCKRCKP